jgi:hypothetical protein
LINTPISTDLNSVQFINTDTGFVVGNDGTILKTTDGGSTWDNQSLATTLDIRRVWPVNYNTIYLGIDSNNVYKTSTSGISLDLITVDDNVYCNGYVNLQTNMNYNGAGTVTYTWASSPYLSNTNTASPTAGPLTMDQTFYVTATDGSITDIDSIQISVVALPTDTICMVTVDDTIGHNLLVFEQNVVGPVHYYNIYRESSVAGVYDSIGFIPADSAGVFVDSASNPAVQQYSYKVSTVDSCGNESTLSNRHTTMHLTVNQGVGTTWNLIWSPYKGMNFPTYRIWRADSVFNWTLIDSVSSSLTSYTDLTPPSGGLYYQVEIVLDHTCQPYLYSKAQTNFNTSRSNTADNGMIIPPPSLQASFAANPTSGVSPLVVNFIDQSTLASVWHWDFGDGDTSMVQNPSHTYTQNGLFTVTLKVSDGTNWDSVSMTGYIDVIDDIFNLQQAAKISIYPNPAQKDKAFRVEYEYIQVENVQLIDIVGRKVDIETTFQTNALEIKIPNVETGIYILQLTDQHNNVHQRKLIIK